jgi:DNA-binding MarR family transcriptional regulator
MLQQASNEDPAVKKMPVSTVFLLKRAELAVRTCVELDLARVGLTPNQLFILVLVNLGEATSSAELARAMGVTPQSMTELLAPLEEMGAVARSPDPSNGRILRITLTPQGERLLERGIEAGQGLERELLGGFSAQGREQLNQALAKLMANADLYAPDNAVQRLKPVGKRRSSQKTTNKGTSNRETSNKGTSSKGRGRKPAA